MLSSRFIDAHNAVFVITADGLDDRQQSAVEQLGDGNFEFVYGVNKKDVTIEEFISQGVYDRTEAIKLNRGNKPMVLGGICCSIGHNKVYQIMEERGIRRALIFEDDVLVNETSGPEISAALDDMPADAELVLWDWSGPEFRPWFATLKEHLYLLEHRLGILKWNPTMIRNMFPREYNRSFLCAGRHYLANAYTLTLDGARKLLRLNTPVILTPDDAMVYAIMNGDLNGFLSKKRFFGQRTQGAAPTMASLLTD